MFVLPAVKEKYSMMMQEEKIKPLDEETQQEDAESEGGGDAEDEFVCAEDDYSCNGKETVIKSWSI